MLKSLLMLLFALIALPLTAESGDAPSYNFVGRHLVASYHGCDKAALTNTEKLADVMLEACKASGATILGSSQYPFDGNGLTMVIMLSESHASIHTYPEFDACFVDIFTCGHKCSQEKFDAVLQAYLKPTNPKCEYITRE